MTSVFVAEDNLGMREMLEEALLEGGYRVESASDGEEAIRKLDKEEFDVVITDYKMPKVSGMEVLKHVHQKWPETILIMITAHGSIEHAVSAMRKGAFDYVTKPFSIEEIEAKVTRAISQRKMLIENQYLRNTIKEQYGRIIGSSSKMVNVKELITKVAPSQTPILILGESGTGKELVAREIHEQSPWHEGPFIPINCAALPDTLLESELFGYEKGAFTGAAKQKKGRVEVAEGGTLFLDEIGEIALPIQVKLLRFLQDKFFERVGGVERIKVDCRIITATNQPLQDMIKEGKFREDLYYRVNVLNIDLPPLREHSEDIPELVEFFSEKLNLQLHKKVKFSSKAMDVLKQYHWAGNVRELENILERTIVLAESELIEAHHLPMEFYASKPGISDSEQSESLGILQGFSATNFKTLTDQLAYLERKIILSSLEKNRWNQTASAKELGLKRSSLQYKIKKYGLDKT